MKVKILPSLAKVWPDGDTESWMPGAVVDVDELDTLRVAYFRELASVGLAIILEDAPVAAATVASGVFAGPVKATKATPAKATGDGGTD